MGQAPPSQRIAEKLREAIVSGAFGPGAKHYENQEELIAVLAAQVRAGVTMLVKGSRGSAMDRVVKALLGAAGIKDGGAHAA